jgi:hypothetical protein
MPQRQRVGSVGSLGTCSVSIIHDDLDDPSAVDSLYWRRQAESLESMILLCPGRPAVVM